MTVASRLSAACLVAVSRRRSPAVPNASAIWAVAAIGFSLVGCSTGELRDSFREVTTEVRVRCAAEKAYLHRGDLFHECCSCPLDFKHGFKNGYYDVAMHGDDCCAPPTPPSCYWGCCTSDPCERVERLNCYYDGWAHGAIAASQDGVAGLNTVPIRNICGGYQQPGMGGPYGPGAPYGAFGPGEPPGVAPPAPTPFAVPNQALPGGLSGPEQLDIPLNGGPTPAPIPLNLPEDGGFDGDDAQPGEVEGSVGGSNADPLLDRLLDSAEDGSPAPNVEPPADSTAEPTFPNFAPDEGQFLDDGALQVEPPSDSTARRGTGFEDVPTRSDEGPRVTALWGGDA